MIGGKKQKTRDEPKRGQEQASAAELKQEKTGKKRDEKGRFVKANDRPVSPRNGQPLPEGKQFRTGDERAKLAGIRSGEVRREKSDLRRLCQLWMEEEVGTDNDGRKITGGQMMVRVAVKEVAKGNPKFWELLRDTAGFKPVDKVMVSEVNPEVIAEVEQLVKEASKDE